MCFGGHAWTRKRSIRAELRATFKGMTGDPLPPPVVPGGPDTPDEKSGSSVLVWSVVVAVLVGLSIVVVVTGFSTDDEPWAGDDGLYGAHAICADFTRDRLKAPGTADFPEYKDSGVTISRSGTTFTVRSFVDAENTFGGNIRTAFMCRVQVSGDTWTLLDWAER